MLNPLTGFGATGARRCSRLLPPISGWNTGGCLSVTGVQSITGKFLVYARALNNKVRKVWRENTLGELCFSTSFDNQRLM